MVKTLKFSVKDGDFRKIARALTIVENDLEGADEILKNLDPLENTPIIGLTGPPGAGKSTLLNALINNLLQQEKFIAVIAVDPSSPFTKGALLGDRIRMRDQFNNKQVYIRSISSRGTLGGLSAKIIEMTDVLKTAGFDYVFVETVGVGQSEVDIAGLADLTIVVLVPESGDEIQSVKSGLMEIADAYVVNKADRDGADTFANTIKALVQSKNLKIPVFKAAASRNEGISELVEFIESYPFGDKTKFDKLLTDKALRLIQSRIFSTINVEKLRQEIEGAHNQTGFNLYKLVEKYVRSS